VPTWHEVRQADTSLIALHLSKAPNFDQFSDLLVSSLKILKKYDRLADRVGADEQTFLDELKIVRIRMEQMSVPGKHPTAGLRSTRDSTSCTEGLNPAMSCSGRKPRDPPPPPPARQKTKMRSLPPRPMDGIQAKKPISIPVIPSSEQVSLLLYELMHDLI